MATPRRTFDRRARLTLAREALGGVRNRAPPWDDVRRVLRAVVRPRLLPEAAPIWNELPNRLKEKGVVAGIGAGSTRHLRRLRRSPLRARRLSAPMLFKDAASGGAEEGVADMNTLMKARRAPQPARWPLAAARRWAAASRAPRLVLGRPSRCSPRRTARAAEDDKGEVDGDKASALATSTRSSGCSPSARCAASVG